MELRHVKIVLSILGSLSVVFPSALATEPATSQEIQKLSDEELRAALGKSTPVTLETLLVPENRLAEVVRRGGKQWERDLRSLIDAQEAEYKRKDYSLPPRHVSLLTALRRIQGKPDPIQVLVVGKRSVACKLSTTALC